MIKNLQAVSATFPDARTGRCLYRLSDIVVSGFAPFFMQDGSFLSFQRKMEETLQRSNCQTLFGMEKIPTDNHIRNTLDGIDPAHLDRIFMDAFQRIETGGVLKTFKAARLDDRLMVAFDGTQYFQSTQIHCPKCLSKTHNKGKDDEWTEYYHTMLCATLVGQGHNLALPLMPEYIANEGNNKSKTGSKQDCEINATKRWLAKHGATFTTYRPVALADALSACQPMLECFKEHGWSYIVTAKPDDLKTLYDFINGCELGTFNETKTIGQRKPVREQHTYRWIEGVPIRDGKSALLVNWVEHIIRRPNKKPVTYAVVTDLPVSSTKEAKAIIAAGRTRWRIENEGFNILKNHGYELEHNWGHGKQFCAMMLASLNLIALAFHTVADLLCHAWMRARAALKVRYALFENLRLLTARFLFKSWVDLLSLMANKHPIPWNSS